MTSAPSIEQLLAEGQAAPVEGWDFSWFEGRATEQRPSWRYSLLLADRLGSSSSSLDVQTGGGEIHAAALAQAAQRPDLVAATESWPPNVVVARQNLARFGTDVLEVAEDEDLPFADGSFDLVSSRHPPHRRWDELARVLRPGGTYLSQGVGSGSNRELYEALMGPQPDDEQPRADEAVAEAGAAGLHVIDLRQKATRVEFFDIAAVVHFLRKVVWTRVPQLSRLSSDAVGRFPWSRARHSAPTAGLLVTRSGRYSVDCQRRCV